MTLRKFASRPESVRKRHAPRLLHEQERRCLEGHSVDVPFLRAFMRLLRQESWVTDPCRSAIDEVLRALDAYQRSGVGSPSPQGGGDAGQAVRSDLARALNTARHSLRSASGREYAEWDAFEDVAQAHGNAGIGSRFPIGVFGESIRSPFNVGSIVRSAEAFGAASCRFTPDSASIDHPRAKRSAMGSDAWIDVKTLRLAQLEALGTPLFAVETGGTPAAEFEFPASGIALLGNEELGLSRHARELAGRSAGVVTIPLYGTKASLNVASAAAVVLSWWTSALIRS
ncbi:MAG: TrmH family RNA methyltransferase [Spirochaetota bacterium]